MQLRGTNGDGLIRETRGRFAGLISSVFAKRMTAVGGWKLVPVPCQGSGSYDREKGLCCCMCEAGFAINEG